MPVLSEREPGSLLGLEQLPAAALLGQCLLWPDTGVLFRGEGNARICQPSLPPHAEMPSQRKEKLKKDIVTSSVSPSEKSTGFLEGIGFGLLFLFQSLPPTPRLERHKFK